MMNILRRATQRQLIAGLIAVIVIAAGSAVALAGGGGPKPPPRSLAEALRSAATASHVQGVSARVKFTDNLISSGTLGTSSPLLTGATGRIWAGDGKVRLELQSSAGDTEIGYDGTKVTVYDVASGTAYTLPVAHHAKPDAAAQKHHAVPTVAAIQKALARLAGHVDLSGAIPGDVTGQPVYTVRVSPHHSGGLLGAVELAWDSNHGVPLRIGVYSRTDSSPVLQLAVTDITYGPVPASDLAVPLASGTKVVKVHAPTSTAKAGSAKHAHQPQITGMAAVAKAVPFQLSTPSSLVGLPRQTVRLVDVSGTHAALVVYGHGLGAVAVLEQQATASGAKHSPLAALPSVSIGGASGHELDTALGTVIQFDRAGVRYTVVGSLPPAAAEAAARAVG
jgi:hypothetical protein